MHKLKIGKVDLQKGAMPKPHELTLAEILARTGHKVTFIAVGINKTPDIYFLNKFWEIKSPTGKSSRTIENNLRAALTQSKNVIIDLRRTTIPDSKAMTYLNNHIKNFHGLQNLLIVTKEEKLFKITPKNPCLKEIPLL